MHDLLLVELFDV